MGTASKKKIIDIDKETRSKMEKKQKTNQLFTESYNAFYKIFEELKGDEILEAKTIKTLRVMIKFQEKVLNKII